MRDARVIIVGGGYSGAMTAAHLASRGIAATVVEPGTLGRGAAYAATPYRLLLNTPSSAMSALPNAPRHFEAWLERHRTPAPRWPADLDERLGESGDAAVRLGWDRSQPAPRWPADRAERNGASPVRLGRGPAGAAGGPGGRAQSGDDGFVARAVYGDYLEHTIAELARGRLDVVHARATSLDQVAAGFVVGCDDGSQLTAPSLVLALGNPPPRTPSAVMRGAGPGAAALPGYLAEPLRAIASIETDDDVAILGTGLTALDVIAGLRARGHRGRIVCASRRGLIPTAHGAGPIPVFSVPRGLVRQPQLRELLGWWRDRLERSCPPGDRTACEAALIAALRPFISTIWRRLPVADRARFLRHVRPRWDVLRHRAPPSVRGFLDRGVAERSIEVLAARLTAVDATAAGLRCCFAAADGSTPVRDVRWLVNCTGPERDVRRLDSPLVRALLERRLLASDPLGLGVLTGPGGQLIGERGAVPGAFVVGPWRMADLFEASAVPELRQHAADTASAIAGACAAALPVAI